MRSRGRGWRRAHRGAVGENALSPSPPAPGPAGLRAAPARCRQAGGSEGKWRGASALLCPGRPHSRGSSRSLCGTASPGCSRGDKGQDPKGQREPSDRVLTGSRAPWNTRGKAWACGECDLCLYAIWLRWVAPGAGAPRPPCHAGTPPGWAGYTATRQSLSKRAAAAYRLLPEPHTQQSSGRGTRATQRCRTQPTAAQQLFPAVLSGLWVTRCVLTSSCASAKALYPQAKTSTLAISKSNMTVTIIIIFTQFCCCCCYKHRSSI